MVKIKHRLRILMAQNEIKSIVKLSELTGIEYQTLYNFYAYIHKKLDPEIVSILCATLKCDIGDLLYLNKEIE